MNKREKLLEHLGGMLAFGECTGAYCKEELEDFDKMAVTLQQVRDNLRAF
jgi:hypothetical protein